VISDPVTTIVPSSTGAASAVCVSWAKAGPAQIAAVAALSDYSVRSRFV
jgi:hypothetical protein